MSLSVVNATKAWDSQVLRFNRSLDNIDGTGVTVCVVDTGIDASHPDMDYGTKTIRNLKSDSGTGPWYEIENGDTSSGHGTHVAGTVAGNGDASAGQRAGVAPGGGARGAPAARAPARCTPRDPPRRTRSRLREEIACSRCPAPRLCA